MPAASASWLVNDAAVSMAVWLFLRSCFQFFQINAQKWHGWFGDSPISITVKLFCIPISRDKSSDFSKTPSHSDFLFNGILWARTLTSRVFKGSPTPDSNSECQIRHRVSALYSSADWGLWEPKWLWYGLDITHCPDRRLTDIFSCFMSRFNSADFVLSCIKVCNLFIIFIFFNFLWGKRNFFAMYLVLDLKCDHPPTSAS